MSRYAGFLFRIFPGQANARHGVPVQVGRTRLGRNDPVTGKMFGGKELRLAGEGVLEAAPDQGFVGNSGYV